jgi:hypothetical protein
MGYRSTAELVNDLADRYVSLWNEADVDTRHRMVRELWTEGGGQILQPPQEIRDAAVAMGMDATFEVRGHEALDTRVSRAYEEFVASGEYRFSRRSDAARLHGIVKFNWEMVRTSDGTPAGAGLELLVLGDDGRIVTDYQFIDG